MEVNESKAKLPLRLGVPTNSIYVSKTFIPNKSFPHLSQLFNSLFCITLTIIVL